MNHVISFFWSGSDLKKMRLIHDCKPQPNGNLIQKDVCIQELT